MPQKYVTITAALVFWGWFFLFIVGPGTETALSTAPARVLAYLATVGALPQGAVLCRETKGTLHLVDIQCEAMVESVLTRFACDTATCWPR
jgi:hypothetical protein